MDMKDMIGYSQVIFVPNAFKCIHQWLLILSSHDSFPVTLFCFNFLKKILVLQPIAVYFLHIMNCDVWGTPSDTSPKYKNKWNTDWDYNQVGNYTLCLPIQTLENLHEESTVPLNAAIWKERPVQEFLYNQFMTQTKPNHNLQCGFAIQLWFQLETSKAVRITQDPQDFYFFFPKVLDSLFVEAVLQFSLHVLQCSIAAVTLSHSSLCVFWCCWARHRLSFSPILTQQASEFRWQRWLWRWKQWWSCFGLSSSYPLHLLLCLLVLSHVHFLSCLYHPVCCSYSFCLKWQYTHKMIDSSAFLKES